MDTTDKLSFYAACIQVWKENHGENRQPYNGLSDSDKHYKTLTQGNELATIRKMGNKEDLLGEGISKSHDTTHDCRDSRDRHLDTKNLDLLEERCDQWSYNTASRRMSKSGKGDSRSKGQISKGLVDITVSTMGSPGII